MVFSYARSRILHRSTAVQKACLSVKQRDKGHIPLRYLAETGPKPVADLLRAGIWPIIYSWLAASWHQLAGLRQVCDQPRTCLRPGQCNGIWLRTGLRPGSSRFELSRHVEIARS